jgi:hypothetical protein
MHGFHIIKETYTMCNDPLNIFYPGIHFKMFMQGILLPFLHEALSMLPLQAISFPLRQAVL